MAEEGSRRQYRNAPTTARFNDRSVSHETLDTRPKLLRWLHKLPAELSGSVDDHQNWISSDRARTLESVFIISGRLLSYAAYITLAWLAFRSVIGIRSGIVRGTFTIPEFGDGSRVALFNILAAGLIGPLIIIAIGFGIVWAYNLTAAGAKQALPRFAQPLIYPLFMFAVAAVIAFYHSSITATAARGYLHAKANIEAASPTETAAVKMKVIEIPGLGILNVDESAEHSASNERELVQLKSIFNNRKPCLQENQGTELNPQPETARPEPGLTPAGDCQEQKTNLLK